MSQKILFCAERYMQNVSSVEELIRKSFPEPQYTVISLRIDPDRVAGQVAQWVAEQKIFSDSPALFFYWSCAHHRADDGKIWQPLFEKCKAVALVDFLSGELASESVRIGSFWESAWNCENSPHKIVNIDTKQQSLTDIQRIALEEICNVEVKKNTSEVKKDAGKERYYTLVLLAVGALILIGLLYRRKLHHIKLLG